MANGSCRPTKTALETIIEFGGLSSHSTYQPASMKPFCFHPSVSVIICTRDPERILCSNRGELRRKSLESSQWDFRCQQANRAGQSSAAKFIRNNYLRLLSLERLFCQNQRVVEKSHRGSTRNVKSNVDANASSFVKIARLRIVKRRP
jgi:hypothetical protein